MGMSGRPRRTFTVLIRVATKELKCMMSNKVKQYTERYSPIHIHKYLTEIHELNNLAKSWIVTVIYFFFIYYYLEGYNVVFSVAFP